MISLSHLPQLAVLGSLLAFAAASFGAESPKPSPSSPTPAVEAVDHLLLGVPDLEAGMKWFEERTGIRPAAGGSHPGRGTRNALVSLGGRYYLEIIAPDPAQTGVDNELAAGLKKLTAPRLIGWAAAGSDLEATLARLDAEKVAHSPATPGARKRPDGKELSWRTVAVQSDLGESIPFFIDWGTTAHPSASAPAGARLVALTFRHPKPEALTAELARLGIATEVTQSAQPGLAARIETPRGVLSLD
ncbi:MAG TPA: VOC family protein [Thermoanaerobaculia bacterium]|nr:VOC family protein [Thermoanaerobaculia bacterium]